MHQAGERQQQNGEKDGRGERPKRSLSPRRFPAVVDDDASISAAHGQSAKTRTPFSAEAIGVDEVLEQTFDQPTPTRTGV